MRLPVGGRGSCPNRGPSREGGCLYCDARGSGTDILQMDLPIEAQIAGYVRTGKRYVLYFQPYTATHGDWAPVAGAVEAGLGHPQIVGLAIGTRPDCLDPRAWNWLEGLHRRTHLELEMGLQTASDATLAFLNRGHTAADFAASARHARALGLRVVAHVILGLPGEGEAEGRATAAFLNGLPIHGIKVHPLHIMKSSPMAALYGIGRMAEGGERFSAPGAPDLAVLTRERYISLLSAFLEVLRDEVVIYRFTGERRGTDFLGPRWLVDKGRNLNEIRRALAVRGIHLNHKGEEE